MDDFFCFFGPINSILIKSWGDMDVVSSALVFFVVRLALCEFFWCWDTKPTHAILCTMPLTVHLLFYFCHMVNRKRVFGIHTTFWPYSSWSVLLSSLFTNGCNFIRALLIRFGLSHFLSALWWLNRCWLSAKIFFLKKKLKCKDLQVT